MKSKVILVEDLEGIEPGQSCPVPAEARISPLARETARQRGIRFVEAGPRAIALGADHGGYAAKEEVKAYLEECGYSVQDLGTYDEEPVDYPDIAHRVAKAVSSGSCGLGIIVDGAGIGSSMAANKVPGVRAALCYDEATARNSREHNYANVLTLGGRLLSSEEIKQVVKTWLETPYGAERHRRRVDKINGIEKLYSR